MVQSATPFADLIGECRGQLRRYRFPARINALVNLHLKASGVQIVRKAQLCPYDQKLLHLLPHIAIQINAIHLKELFDHLSVVLLPDIAFSVELADPRLLIEVHPPLL